MNVFKNIFLAFGIVFNVAYAADGQYSKLFSKNQIKLE